MDEVKYMLAGQVYSIPATISLLFFVVQLLDLDGANWVVPQALDEEVPPVQLLPT